MPAYDDSFSPPAPVARVSLRHPESSLTVKDVLMLIDSGADVTLIPKSSFDLFGLEIDLADTFQVNRGQTCLLTLESRFDMLWPWHGNRESNLREPCTM